MFFIGSETEYDENGHSHEQLVIGSFTQQCACSCIMSCAEYFGKTLNHPGDSVPLQSRFGTLQLLAFPQAKITFERVEISDPQ